MGNVGSVLHTSVATLYSNLVTRPTGRAVRLAIERQMSGNPGFCLSILDFSEVSIIDFSCADEVIAKLLLKYRRVDRPVEAFFLAKGVRDHHLDPIEAVLRRHDLLLTAIDGSGERTLLGPAPPRLKRAWSCLDQLGRACVEDFASAGGLEGSAASSWLKRLAARRLAVPYEKGDFCSLVQVLEFNSAAGGT